MPIATGSLTHAGKTAPDTDGSMNAETAAHSDVLVFVGQDQKDMQALGQAQRVAQAFGGSVMLLRIMAPSTDGIRPIDPVDWDIRKQTARKCLDRLAQALDKKGKKVRSEILEGQCADQILAFTESRRDDIAAALRARNDGRWRLSDTLSGVLHSHSTAILVIPQGAPARAQKGVGRILVPIDGSARAESALPRAVTLAKAENAELLLCYVTPEPGLTEFGIMDSTSLELRKKVTRRNAQAGQLYLKRITNSLAHHGLRISNRIVAGADARRALLQTAAEEEADFLVMAAHGESGHSDVPTGDVASFILDRAEIPVLMVRHQLNDNDRHATGSVASAGIRKPSGTDA